MGKRIRSQRRGKGSVVYRARSHRFKGEVKYRTFGSSAFGKVVELVHCPVHSAPLMLVRYDDGVDALMIAPEGVSVGSVVGVGDNIPPEVGCVLPLGSIPEGSSVFNIECKPGDGGKIVRASGGAAKVIAKSDGKVSVRLPSRKTKLFNAKCRATVGVVAGGGRRERPLLKAGNKWKKIRAKGGVYPTVCGVAMNAVDHPFGCGRGRNKGKCTIAPRYAPPGRKVGKVGARRTGRRK